MAAAVYCDWFWLRRCANSLATKAARTAMCSNCDDVIRTGISFVPGSFSIVHLPSRAHVVLAAGLLIVSSVRWIRPNKGLRYVHIDVPEQEQNGGISNQFKSPEDVTPTLLYGAAVVAANTPRATLLKYRSMMGYTRGRRKKKKENEKKKKKKKNEEK